MAKYTDAIRDVIIAAFNAGDQPTEAQFTNWITRVQEGIEEHDHDGTGDGDGIAAIGITGITSAGTNVPDGWYLGIGAALERIVFDDAGNIGVMGATFGIGTVTAPHTGIGGGVVAVDGAAANWVTGPHMQFTSATDNYPIMALVNYGHDAVGIAFDAYTDGAWKSSDVGSNYRIIKYDDALHIEYDSAVAQGGAVGWNEGIVLSTAGAVKIPSLAGVGIRAVVAAADGTLSAP